MIHYPAAYILDPPALYRHSEASKGAIKILLPFEGIPKACGSTVAQYKTPMGCYLGGFVVLPTFETFPYDAQCYAHLTVHEYAHTWGWSEDHPRGDVYICSPKD